jgi:hypothetical protein
MLLKETIERTGMIESKARTLVGFPGAILAILVSSFQNWKPAVQTFTVAPFLMLMGVVLLILGALFGVTTLSTREFQWIDEKDGLVRKRILPRR